MAAIELDPKAAEAETKAALEIEEPTAETKAAETKAAEAKAAPAAKEEPEAEPEPVAAEVLDTDDWSASTCGRSAACRS